MKNGGPWVDDSVGSDPPDEDELIHEIETISLTPTEHQRIKDIVNGERLARITGFTRRYLVAGAGTPSDAARRRETVYTLLSSRSDPSAIAMQLEDFGLTPEDIRLWVRVFDLLCGSATHIVGVVEDFEGGYVWELGLLWAPMYREKVWVLKRVYPDSETERERSDNGMAISHVKLLLTGDRCIEWVDVDELRDAVSEIP